MKRTNKVTTATVALLFIAMLLYIGFYLYTYITGRMQTAVAVIVTVRESIGAEGILIRDELVIESPHAYVSVSAAEGKRVGKDQTVAVAYGSEAALARAGRIRELKLEIEYINALMGGQQNPELITSRDSAIRDSVLALSASVARHELRDLDAQALRLRSLVFDGGELSVSKEELDRLNEELMRLESAGRSDTLSITAPEAGLFSASLDGYEHISPKSLGGLTPSGLRAMLGDRREPSPNALAKLVCSQTWYLAAVVSEEGSVYLWEILQSAQSRDAVPRVNVEFGRYYNSSLSSRIVEIGEAVDGECVVVLSCSYALAETLTIRQISAEIIFDESRGIRVPKEAVRVKSDEGAAIRWRENTGADTDQKYFVYTLTGQMVEAKTVEIIYEGGDFYLLGLPTGQNSLREGDEVIITGNDLYSGKIISTR